MKRQEKLNRDIIFESVLMLFAENCQLSVSAYRSWRVFESRDILYIKNTFTVSIQITFLSSSLPLMQTSQYFFFKIATSNIVIRIQRIVLGPYPCRALACSAVLRKLLLKSI